MGARGRCWICGYPATRGALDLIDAQCGFGKHACAHVLAMCRCAAEDGFAASDMRNVRHGDTEISLIERNTWAILREERGGIGGRSAENDRLSGALIARMRRCFRAFFCG